jgi:aldehyde dehydrogenase (NAD+)
MYDLRPLRQFFDSGGTRPYEWRRQQLLSLRQMILDHEEEIYAGLHKDLGKSPEEAYGSEVGLVLSEISHTLKRLRQWMRPRRVGTNLVNWPSSSTIYRDPLGVVLVIAPWNYPLQLSLLPVAAALAGGNAIVLKPSELAPATATLIEKMVTATFPRECITVVQGDGATVVPALISSFRFDHIFFTGSVAVGRSVYQLAAQQLIPVTLELGGKSPVVVANDADLRITARRIAVGKFTNAGQTCIAPDYILVQRAVKDELVSRLVAVIGQFYGAKPEESPDYGRIINERRFDTLVGYLRQSNVLFGGQYDRNRLFIGPTLLEVAPGGEGSVPGKGGVAPDMPVMNDEIFGPLLPIVTYDTMHEAVAIVRRHPDPLAFYLFTRDKETEKMWLENVCFGGGCINNTDWHFTNPHLPFGGVGNSGFGAYHGKRSFDTFTREKAVMKTPAFPDPDIKYPPFKGKMKWFKFFLK